MNMNKYLITIERKQITTMLVPGDNEDDAINKVNDLMSKCEKNKSSFEKIFDRSSFFKYKAESLNNKKLT